MSDIFLADDFSAFTTDAFCTLFFSGVAGIEGFLGVGGFFGVGGFLGVGGLTATTGSCFTAAWLFDLAALGVGAALFLADTVGFYCFFAEVAAFEAALFLACDFDTALALRRAEIVRFAVASDADRLFFAALIEFN